MSLTEQADLGERLRDSDEETLAEILRVHGPPTAALLRLRFTGILNGSDLDDVLSIALFRLWQSRETYSPMKSSLAVWFLRIAENAARDVLKYGWYKARRQEVSTAPPILAEYARNPESHHEQPTKVTVDPRHTDLQEALAGLSHVQQVILRADALARDRVAASEHLARELGIPANSVPVYRKRAMDKLRKELRRRGHTIPE